MSALLLFVKVLLQMATHAYVKLSVFFEIFLLHEITWIKYQNVFIFSLLIS